MKTELAKIATRKPTSSDQKPTSRISAEVELALGPPKNEQETRRRLGDLLHDFRSKLQDDRVNMDTPSWVLAFGMDHGVKPIVDPGL